MPKPPSELPDHLVTPNPKLEQRTRRQFSTEYKLRILAEADACQHGELGELLRREKLYSSQLTTWRKELDRHRVLAEQVIDQPLVLHADNGSPFKGATLLEKLHDLGITPSFSRSRVSNDNPYSESLFRTCKYRPCYPEDGFASLDAAQQWVHGFVQWYNLEHRHSGIRLVTPAQRHAGDDAEVLGKCHAINQAARAANPARWSGKTRNWRPIGVVSLNPERELHVTTPEPEKWAA